jgi:hypothetical protein
VTWVRSSPAGEALDAAHVLLEAPAVGLEQVEPGGGEHQRVGGVVEEALDDPSLRSAVSRASSPYFVFTAESGVGSADRNSWVTKPMRVGVAVISSRPPTHAGGNSGSGKTGAAAS